MSDRPSTGSTETRAKPSLWGRRTFFAFVFIALITSIAANVALFRLASTNYGRLSEAQLDPFGLKRTSYPPDSPAGDAGRTLPAAVFFGDSRARGWPAPGVGGFRFVNRGIAGQTTAQVLGRFDAHVAPASPRVVILQAGINDLKAIPLFPERRAEIVADCKANLRRVADLAVGRGATVVVTTIFPPGDVTLDRRPVWSPDIERAVEEVNAELRTWASDRIVVLDAWTLLEDHGKLRGGLGVDTLHLNAKGYEVLNAELAKVLAGLPVQSK